MFGCVVFSTFYVVKTCDIAWLWPQDLWERFIELTNGQPVQPVALDVAMGRQLVLPRAGEPSHRHQALPCSSRLCVPPLNSARRLPCAEQPPAPAATLPPQAAARCTARSRSCAAGLWPPPTTLLSPRPGTRCAWAACRYLPAPRAARPTGS
jgi:hypothetical protein